MKLKINDTNKDSVSYKMFKNISSQNSTLTTIEKLAICKNCEFMRIKIVPLIGTEYQYCNQCNSSLETLINIYCPVNKW